MPKEDNLKAKATKLLVLGIGGAGNNTINRLPSDSNGVTRIALNTDAQDLLKVRADKKLIIGESITHGLGAGSNPKIGKAAAEESASLIKEALKGYDMAFLTCGLGGGTGTGAIPVVSRLCREQGMLTLAVVTLPFTIEGKHRMDNASEGLKELEQSVDTLVVIKNDKLLELVPELPVEQAFRFADEVLAKTIKGTAELVMLPGLINIDYANMVDIMKHGGLSIVGFGESSSETRAMDAVRNAMKNPLLDGDISNASGALLSITAGSDFTLEEAYKIVNSVIKNLSQDAKLAWGARIDESFEKKISIMLIVTGL